MKKLIDVGFDYTNFRKDRFNNGNITYYFERTEKLEKYLESTARVQKKKVHMNDIKVNGTQIFMGIEIPVIEGGFGENCRVVSAKTISQIHDMRLSDVNASINRLIRKKRIKDNIDFVNLLSETVSLRNFAKSLGLVSSNRTKDGFILSERGYSKTGKSDG